MRSIRTILTCIPSLTKKGVSSAPIASRESTPGVCHSNLPPLSTFSRTFTINWHRVNSATLGISQDNQSVVLTGPRATLLIALMWIPHPEIITNIGAAIPPNAAATKAAGSPTVIPLGGMMAAVWTSTIHKTAIALMRSICASLNLSPRESCYLDRIFYRTGQLLR